MRVILSHAGSAQVVESADVWWFVCDRMKNRHAGARADEAVGRAGRRACESLPVRGGDGRPDWVETAMTQLLDTVSAELHHCLWQIRGCTG